MAARLQRPAPIGRIPAARAPVGCSAGPSPGLALPRRIAPGQRAAEGRREPLPAPRPADSDRHRDGTGSRTRDRERDHGPGQGAGTGSRDQGTGAGSRGQGPGTGIRTRDRGPGPAARAEPPLPGAAAPRPPCGRAAPPAPRVPPVCSPRRRARGAHGQGGGSRFPARPGPGCWGDGHETRLDGRGPGGSQGRLCTRQTPPGRAVHKQLRAPPSATCPPGDGV